MYLGRVKGFDVSTVSGFSYVIYSKLSPIFRTDDINGSWRELRPLFQMQTPIIIYFTCTLEKNNCEITVTIPHSHNRDSMQLNNSFST